MKMHHDELRWLYMELYGNASMFAELCGKLEIYYEERKDSLKARDEEREKNPRWFRDKGMLGMMLYIDNFAGDMNGVREKLAYLESCHVN